MEAPVTVKLTLTKSAMVFSLNVELSGCWGENDIMACLYLEMLGSSWDVESHKFCIAVYSLVFGVQVNARLYQVVLSMCILTVFFAFCC